MAVKLVHQFEKLSDYDSDKSKDILTKLEHSLTIEECAACDEKKLRAECLEYNEDLYCKDCMRELFCKDFILRTLSEKR